jgi:hypothetical protein
MMRAFLNCVLALGAFAGCKKDPVIVAAADAGRTNAEVARMVEAIVDAGTEPPKDAAPPTTRVLHDAGVQRCRVLYGPEEMPFRGPATMRVSGNTLELWLNQAGTPRIHKVPIVPPGAPVKPQALRGDGFPVGYPACALGGAYVYCVGHEGKIQRTPLKGGASREVATAKVGTRIVAASLGAEHSMVGYLESRRTSEGFVVEAWGVLDEGTPVRISEEGTGATWFELGTRANEAVAFTIDARAAMSPMHARTLTFKNGALDVGPDAVLYVGGPGERGLSGTLAIGGNDTHALIAQSTDALHFGMIALPISMPIRDNVHGELSAYPNGVEPAPIAATQERDPVYVVRQRPLNAEIASPKMLELGTLSPIGTFQSIDLWSPHQNVMDLGIVRDAFGTLWITHGDARAVWLERRQCPN